MDTAAAVAREAAGDLAGAANSRIAQGIASRVYHTPWKGMLKGLGTGLAGGVANFAVDQWSNNYEDIMYDDAVKISEKADEKLDQNSHIGIVATQP